MQTSLSSESILKAFVVDRRSSSHTSAYWAFVKRIL